MPIGILKYFKSFPILKLVEMIDSIWSCCQKFCLENYGLVNQRREEHFLSIIAKEGNTEIRLSSLRKSRGWF